MMCVNKAIGCTLGGSWLLAGIGCLMSEEFRTAGACASMVGMTYCWYRLVLWSEECLAKTKAG